MNLFLSLKISATLKGQCGLLFTDCKEDEVVDWFSCFSYAGFARSGFKVNQNITLNEGPLKQFSHAIEPYLRQLGMPTKLDRGVVTLIKNYEVCKSGDILTPEKAKILELLDHRLAMFNLILKARWIKGDGFKKLNEDDEDECEEKIMRGRSNKEMDEKYEVELDDKMELT